MKQFLLRIILCSLVFCVVFESILRILSLAAHTVPEANVEGNRLLKPLASGYYVGGGCREIFSHYQINEQGWNSLRDYELDNENTNLIKIALIGDSYIEGLQSDVENSVGRLLEQSLGDDYAVHEFGKSGGNIEDYSRVYEELSQYDYEHVFVFLSSQGDLTKKNPTFMGKGNEIPKLNLLRRCYNASAILRYVNINHGLIESLRKLFGGRDEPEVEGRIAPVADINLSALSLFGENVVFLYESDKIDSDVLSLIRIPVFPVEHSLKPYNHGFDHHWNVNGRANVATTIFGYIKPGVGE